MPKAVLVDLRRCMGCRGCQAACKQWNETDEEIPTVQNSIDAVNRGSYENPPDLSARTWTLVKFRELEDNGRLVWQFSKWQCMHCLQPACVTVCPTRALQKLEEGPVLYDESRCIGCAYCVNACPFSIPRFDWEKDRMITKCNMCADRVGSGLEPACVKACPPGALIFDERDAIMSKVNTAESEGAHVYGRDEVGGTSWIYVSNVDFEKGEFPEVGTTAYPSHSGGIWISQFATVAVAALGVGLYSLYLRRKKLEGEQQ